MNERATDEAPLVATVVLNWRRREGTLSCLGALARLEYPRNIAILVDNGCEDFSAAEIAALLPTARYLRAPVNLGFAGGANLGMREALRLGAEFVWFLNNDAQPEPAALAELVAVADASPQNDIVGAKILLQSDPARLDSIALRIDLRHGRILLLGHNELDLGQYDGPSNPMAVTGCAMLVRRSACEQLGGFDESFFAYLEDADLCLRAVAAGLRVAVAPRSRVLHDRRPAGDGRQSVSSLYYTARNHLLLLERHGPGGRLTGRLRLVTAALLAAAYAARSGQGSRSQRLRAVWRGVADFRRGRYGEGSETN